MGLWLAGVDFHRFSIKFLLETEHFGALAGWGSFFFFSLIFYSILIRDRSLWGSGWPALHFQYQYLWPQLLRAFVAACSPWTMTLPTDVVSCSPNRNLLWNWYLHWGFCIRKICHRVQNHFLMKQFEAQRQNLDHAKRPSAKAYWRNSWQA